MKLSKLEKYWALYDVGNSAFILFVSTIIPIYFDYLAQKSNLSAVDYLAYWGYAASIATFIVALTGPILGTLSDNKGAKKPLFAITVALGGMGCALLGIAPHWIMFLVIFILAKVYFSWSLILYDSMLVDITSEERMDYVSTQGFAWGYIGSCIPFIVCLGLILGGGRLGLSMESSMMISFLIGAGWWILVAIPLLRNYKQTHYVDKKKNRVGQSFTRLWHTVKSVKREKEIFMFLLAFFFYMDGVYTIIDMATAYGKALGLTNTGLLLALLVTQFVAFPCAIGFGRLAQKIAADQLISICIVAYFGIAIFALFMSTQMHFWILAVCVGMFQGGIQALSRSYFAKIIPRDKSGEYFGILDICGKGAAFMGTALVSTVAQLTGSVNKGVGIIGVLFMIGMILFRKAVGYQKDTIEVNKHL